MRVRIREMDGLCSLCDCPLDLIEMLSLELDDIDKPRFCSECREDEDLMEEYLFGGHQ